MATESEPTTREAAVDPDPAGLQSLATSTEQAQSSARWLIAALAGVGALLVPGLGLTKLGTLEGERLAIALVALLVALAATLLTILALFRFVRSGHLSLAELAERERTDPDDELVAYLRRNSELFREQAGSLVELETLYDEAHEELASAQRRAAAAVPTKDELRVEAATAALKRLEAVSASVMEVARLAGHPDLTLADLANAQRARMGESQGSPPPRPGTREALDYLARHPAILEGAADTFEDLRTKLLDARAELLELKAAGAESPPAKNAPATVEQAEARLGDLKDVIQQIEPAAGLEDLRLTFKRRRLLVAFLPLVIAAAMAAFVAAANEPPVARNDLSGQTIRGADLTGTKLEGADLSGTTFVDSKLTGADVDGADRDGATFIRTECPDGHLTASAGADTTCRGHFEILRPPDIRPTTGGIDRRAGDDGRG